jgi:hypothetical protein
MNEVNNNELNERDKATNALIPLIVLASALDEGDKVTVKSNKLYKVDETTNALIPIVSMCKSGGSVESDKVMIPMPDYDAIEAVNRITVKGGKWVADRTGYCRVSATMITGDWWDANVGALNPDGSWVKGVTILRHNGIVASGKEGERDVVMVKKGDCIQITSNGTLEDISCYFIPIVFVEKEPAVVVVEKNGSYSYDEVETPDRWIDGRLIYKKTVTFVTTEASMGDAMTIGDKSVLSADIHTLVKTEVCEYRNSDLTQSLIGYFAIVNGVFNFRTITHWGAGYILHVTAFYTKN